MHEIRHCIAIPRNRTASLLFHSVPGRPRSVPADRKVVLGRGPQYADLNGSARPPGPIFNAHFEESSGRNPAGQDAAGSQPRIRLPITLEVLAKIQRHLETTSHPHHQVVWTIAITAFFGFFRLGELLASFDPTTQLAWGDVAVDNHQRPCMVRIHIKKAKCDQFGAGSDVVVGRTETDICPVIAMLDYIVSRGSSPGPFFFLSSKDLVTEPWFVAQLRTILAAVGLPQHQYAGHSFRIGAATTAAMVGIDDSTIEPPSDPS